MSPVFRPRQRPWSPTGPLPPCLLCTLAGRIGQLLTEPWSGAGAFRLPPPPTGGITFA